MSQAVWRFERTVQETIQELRDIIQRDDDIRASQVQGEWVYRAQLIMEPAGWDALWRLPRETCQKLGVRFPLVVYVTVDGLDMECSEETDAGGCLHASLEVLGVQDDNVHLPAHHPRVPLEQLWPLRAQPNSAMHVHPTAQFIDLYRYFYTLIWMPWDLDSDEECGWFERNVPARCALWAGALGHIHGAPAAASLKALREEATLLARRITLKEQELPSDTEDNTLDCSGEQMSELVSLHSRLLHVRSQWEALQNPAMRVTPQPQLNLPPKNLIIWMGGSTNSLMSHLKMTEEWLNCGNALVHVSPSLTDALQQRPPPHSNLILCPGAHRVPCDVTVGDDYTLVSVEGDTSLTCPEQRTTALAVTGNACLVRLTLDAAGCSTALAVRAGRTEAQRCRMLCPSPRHTDVQAAVVYSGTSLVLSNCSIDGFFTGIVAHAGSKVRMEDCTVTGCGVALQVYAGASVTLVRCVFKEYAEAAIRYETGGVDASERGGTNLLHRYSDITLTDCKFFNNGVNEVFIARLDENASPEWEGDIATD